MKSISYPTPVIDPQDEIKSEAPYPNHHRRIFAKRSLSVGLSRILDKLALFFLGGPPLPALCFRCGKRPATWNTELCMTCYRLVLDGVDERGCSDDGW